MKLKIEPTKLYLKTRLNDYTIERTSIEAVDTWYNFTEFASLNLRADGDKYRATVYPVTDAGDVIHELGTPVEIVDDSHKGDMYYEAYKLASSFYLSSIHDEWSGKRIRGAILADEDESDEQALSDQQQLRLWDPIEQHVTDRSPMADPKDELDDLIDSLATSFIEFKEDGNNIRKVVIEHGITAIKDGTPFPPRILPAAAFGSDFDKFEGLTLMHEEGMTVTGVSVIFKQTFLYTKKTDEQLLKQFSH
jgi:hypothetical protein